MQSAMDTVQYFTYDSVSYDLVFGFMAFSPKDPNFLFIYASNASW